MFAKLFALFTIVPILELFVLIPLAGEIGVPWTLAIIAMTALVGAFLGKQQGTRAWKAVTEDLTSGALPADSIVDGLLVFAGCILLVTPGVLTDLVGLSLLFPFTRAPIRALTKRRFAKRIEQQTWSVVTDAPTYASDYYGSPFSAPNGPGTSDVIDITPVEKVTEHAH